MLERGRAFHNASLELPDMRLAQWISNAKSDPSGRCHGPNYTWNQTNVTIDLE